jgi:hypothetical protein
MKCIDNSKKLVVMVKSNHITLSNQYSILNASIDYGNLSQKEQKEVGVYASIFIDYMLMVSY